MTGFLAWRGVREPADREDVAGEVCVKCCEGTRAGLGEPGRLPWRVMLGSTLRSLLWNWRNCQEVRARGRTWLDLSKLSVPASADVWVRLAAHRLDGPRSLRKTA